MAGTLCSRIELSRARCTAWVRKRHRGHTDAWGEYGSNNWNRTSTSSQYSVSSRMAKQQVHVRVTFSQICWNTLKQSYHTWRSCLTLYGRAKKFPQSGKMVWSCQEGWLVRLQQLARHHSAVSPRQSVCLCTVVNDTRKAVDIQIYVKNKQVSGQVDHAMIRYSRLGKSLKK